MLVYDDTASSCIRRDNPKSTPSHRLPTAEEAAVVTDMAVAAWHALGTKWWTLPVC